MKKYQLNAKLKILIIVFYTLIVFGVILLLLGKGEYNRFEGYESKSYDENIAITIREMENRKSKYSTSTDKKTLGLHEKSTFDLQVTIVKLQTQAKINNIKIYVSAQTIDGGYRYKEAITSPKTMTELTYTSRTAFSSFSTKEYLEVTKDEAKKEFLFNETPDRFFVKVTYTLDDDTKVNTLSYQISTLDLQEKDLLKAEHRDVITEKNHSNENYVNPLEDPVRIKLTRKDAEAKTTLEKIQNDTIKIQFNVLKNNLNLNKHTEDYLKMNNLKEIEIPADPNDEKAWDVNPEIDEIKYEVYAKIKTTDSKLSEYVKIFGVYGFMSKYRDLVTVNVEIDESFEVDEIIVVAEGKYHNATKTGFNFSFSCKYNELTLF